MIAWTRRLAYFKRELLKILERQEEWAFNKKVAAYLSASDYDYDKAIRSVVGDIDKKTKEREEQKRIADVYGPDSLRKGWSADMALSTSVRKRG